MNDPRNTSYFKMSLILIKINIFLFLFSYNCQAQILTSNDGFEGTPTRGEPPTNWYNCNNGISTVDTQPCFFNNHTIASQGQSYVSLVTREINPPGTVETVWANLLIPLEKDKCYSFSMDLSLSYEIYGTYNFEDYYFDNPCVFQIIGFNGDCSSPEETELLWQSSILDNYIWETKDVILNPTTSTFHNIAFRPLFSPPTNYKNSVVFLDNISFKITPNIFILQDEIFNLPTGSTGITWYFNDIIIQGENSTQMPFVGNGTYKATFYDINGCYILTSDNLTIDFNDIKVYPNPTTDKVTLEFFSSENGSFIIHIYDAIGRFILKDEKIMTKGNNKSILNLENQAPGSYFLVVNRQNLDPVVLKLVHKQ